MVNPTTTPGSPPMVVAQGQSSCSIIKEPGKYDILCGKDKTCLSHYGSKHFRGVIGVHRTRYQKASTKHEKMSITEEIVSTLNRTSSRFLKFNATLQGWEEISHMAARDKVGHALRFANNRSRKAKDKIQKKNNRTTKPTKNTTKKETLKKVSLTSGEALTTNAMTKTAATPANTTRVINDKSDYTLLEKRNQSLATMMTTEKKKGHIRKVSDDEDAFSDVASLMFCDPQSAKLEPIDDSQRCSHGKRQGHLRKVSDDDDMFADITSQLFDKPQTFHADPSREKSKGHVRKVSNDDDDTLLFDIDPSKFNQAEALNYSCSHPGHPSPVLETVVDFSPVAVIEPNEDIGDYRRSAATSHTYPYSTGVIVDDDSSDCGSNDSAAALIEQEDEYGSNDSTGPVNFPVSCTPFSSKASSRTEEQSKDNERFIENKKHMSNTNSDLSWIMNEPLMEWDLATDTIFIL